MVKLAELVPEEGIFLDLQVTNLKDALEQITRCMVESGLVAEEDRPQLFKFLHERENLCSTAVGNGVAIPHAYFDKLAKPMVVISHLAQPVDYCGPDEQPVDLIFLLLGPKRLPRQHMQILSKIVRMIKDQQFDEELRTAKDAKIAMNALIAVEERHH
ncbi:MAG: PTS sugar transporter subunit IIA [Alphaproteobacteria bacterium]